MMLPDDSRCKSCKEKCNGKYLCKGAELTLPNNDITLLNSISQNEEFLSSMAELYANNPIDYELKLAPLREQRKMQSQQEQRQQEIDKNTVRCPKCGSTAIDTVNRGFSLVTGFLGSGSPRNVCQKCGYKWKP